MKFPFIVRRYGIGSKRRFARAVTPNSLPGLANETERANLGGINGGCIKREIAIMSTALGE
jgi:hypothetical protein